MQTDDGWLVCANQQKYSKSALLPPSQSWLEVSRNFEKSATPLFSLLNFLFRSLYIWACIWALCYLFIEFRFARVYIQNISKFQNIRMKCEVHIPIHMQFECKKTNERKHMFCPFFQAVPSIFTTQRIT